MHGDAIGTPDGRAVEKPLPEFFDRVIVEAGRPDRFVAEWPALVRKHSETAGA